MLFQDELIASWVFPGSARLFLDSHILPAAAQRASEERQGWERRYRQALCSKAFVGFWTSRSLHAAALGVLQAMKMKALILLCCLGERLQTPPCWNAALAEPAGNSLTGFIQTTDSVYNCSWWCSFKGSFDTQWWDSCTPHYRGFLDSFIEMTCNSFPL